MKISSEYDKSTPRSSPTKQGGQPPPLVGCSSFPGSSWKWGAAASWAAKTASQSPSMNSLTEDDDKSSLFIYQTWIFCKKNGSKRSFLSEIGAQTFCYALYAVTTACCISWQISKLEIWRNTAGKSANKWCTFILRYDYPPCTSTNLEAMPWILSCSSLYGSEGQRVNSGKSTCSFKETKSGTFMKTSTWREKAMVY